ncbi:MAG TPA: DUF2804 domain-containing protein [Myxococcaceae bacterium]|nr:DUF2804 domain-containing protein [Myxococcaceae bacterium]
MISRTHEPLRPAPASIEDHGQPRFGTYAGSLPEVNLARLKGPYRLPGPLRFAKHKRWFYAMIASPEVLAVFSVADLGYAANAFACAVDLRERQVLFDAGYMGLPRPFTAVSNYPAVGAMARFRAPGIVIKLDRPREEDGYRLSARAKARRGLRFSFRGQLAKGGAPPLTVIAPVPGDGVVNVTQKWSSLELSGTLEAGGRMFALDGGMGGLDYTNGYLGRRTSWRWAFASGRLSSGVSFGLNLVEGFNEATEEANENALWLGDQLIPIGRARFEYDIAHVLKAWQISTEDGAVELSFLPIHAHREERDYKLVRSRFIQPLGIFEGTVRVGQSSFRIEKLPGVVEDQDVLW